jgi:hypothetical protein
MKMIPIPKTPAEVFDKNQKASDLVLNQVKHAYKELHDWWQNVGSKELEQIQTEQEAAEFIRIVTRILHPEGARNSLPGSPAPKSGVWLTDPVASWRRARPGTQTGKRSRPRTQKGKGTGRGKRPLTRARKRTR